MPQISIPPPISSEPLSVILLAHNDASHLEGTVAGWLSYLEGLGRPYELIVSDDASSDDSRQHLEQLAASHAHLQVVRLPQPQGEGAALALALAQARHPLVFYTLCDPCFHPADLHELLTRPLSPTSAVPEIDHVHLVSGCRAGRPVPWLLRLLDAARSLLCRILLSYRPPCRCCWHDWRAQAAHLLARILFGLRYQDVACPFRLLRRDVLCRIPLQSSGPFAHIELLAKANFMGLLLGMEMPLPAGHYPLDRRAGPRSSLREQLVELRRLLRNPRFEPAPQQEKALPPPVEPEVVGPI